MSAFLESHLRVWPVAAPWISNWQERIALLGSSEFFLGRPLSYRTPSLRCPYFSLHSAAPPRLPTRSRHTSPSESSAMCIRAVCSSRELQTSALRSEEHTSELQSRSDLVC